MKTIFCDIDGTLIYQHDNFLDIRSNGPKGLLGAADKVFDWHVKGYKIILTTGRPESMREETIKHLEQCNIIYDLLIMDAGSDERIVINDRHPVTNMDRATAFSINRNQGINDIEL